MGPAVPPDAGQCSGAPGEKEIPAPRGTTDVEATREEFRLEIAHGGATALVRRAVSQVFKSWRLAHPPDDALLVITELVQNLSRHTAGDGELRVALGDDTILVEVTDTDPQLPRLRERHARRLDGRGLIIVAGIARRWGCRPASRSGQPGKVVWAELDLHPPRCPC